MLLSEPLGNPGATDGTPMKSRASGCFGEWLIAPHGSLPPRPPPFPPRAVAATATAATAAAATAATAATASATSTTAARIAGVVGLEPETRRHGDRQREHEREIPHAPRNSNRRAPA